MDTNNWRPIAAQGADDPSVETGGDWRTQLSSDSRKNIVNEIVEMLKKNAVHREEKIYAAATSKSEYLLRIALKMLSMESKSHNTVPNSLPPNPSGNNNIPPDSGADSTAQIGHSNGVDWQEEVYQQIKAMKEMYLSELYEMYQIIALELQQHDPLQPLKMAEAMLERVIAFLQVPKSNILPSFKGKLGSYEEQIKILIKVKKYIPPLQQGQLGQPHMQQTQSQVSQVQSHEKQMNPQIQSTNIQGSVPNMQQNNMVDLHHTSLCSLYGVSTSQQNIMNSLQPASSLDSGQGNAVGSLTQTTVGPLQQNTISALQQDNITNPSGLNMLQPDIHLQSNPNMLQDQHLKQQRRMEQLILQQQILQRQKQQQQQLSQQKLMSLMQSQPALLQQQLVLQPQPNQIQRDMQSGLEASQAPGSLLQQQNVIDQQKQLYQSQRPLPETSSKLCGVLMDTSNWRPTAAQGAEPSVETGGDWRTQLPTDSRQTIVNKILETLNKHLPLFCQEELEGLKKIAVRFEEKIYAAAMSQSDYLQKISLKMLAMESKSQTTIPNSVTPNPSGNNNNELCDPGASHNMQPQVRNQGKPLPMSMSANLSQAREQNLSQNMPSNMGSTGIQSSASLTSALPSVSGLSQTSIPNVVGQNISGVPQSSARNSMGQGVPSNMFANPERQMPGRQQLVPQQQQQQSQNSQQYYQQLLNQKFHQQGNFQHTLVHQQNLLQPTSQQSSMQTSSVMQPSMIQSTNLSGLQQNQLSSAQQSGQSMLQHQQAVLRQLQQIQQAANVHQQLLLTQQQQQLMAQQPNATNTQKNLLTGQQNNVGEMQQQPRLMGQQNNLQNMQEHEQHQQQQHQHLMAQQNNLSSMHQPQLSSQSNVSGLQQQQQLLGTQPGNSTMQTNQHSFCPASLDSTAQTGNSNGGDWQEEVHQKIKAMKEMYYPELNEMLQKITLKIQQHDSLPQPPRTEQLEKLKMFKTMLERILAFLQVSKINIIPSFKEKLGSYEKQIINFINSNKMRKPIPPHQQGQLGQPLMQQPQSQVSQVQSLENQINPQIQSMSMQGSVPSIQQNNIVSMQHSSLSSLSGPSSLDSAVGPLQQNTVGAPQQGNVTNFSSQSGVNMLQPNIPLQTNPNMQMMNNQKQQQIQMMEQQMLQQQQQQFNQQAKQQLPAHQMPQVHQMNDINKLKSGVFQQHISGAQLTPYTQQQLKSGASFPLFSLQLLQAGSPQLSQNSSPQIEQQNQLSSLFQSANSPSIVPSPSTVLAPEKPVPGLSPLSNAENIGRQKATVSQPPGPSFAIGTPGISRSSLPAEFTVSDGGGPGSSMGIIASGKSSVTNQPPQSLISAVESMSSEASSASVSDTDSVIGDGHSNGGDSQEEVLQEIKTMKEIYLDELNEIHQDIASQLEQHDSPLPQPLNMPEMYEELDLFKLRL